jgi:hypothetical protein
VAPSKMLRLNFVSSILELEGGGGGFFQIVSFLFCYALPTIPPTRGEEMERSMDTFTTAAKAGFSLLVPQYKTQNIFTGNFWFAGNTLHVCLNYLVAAGEKDTGEKDSPQILPFGFKLFNTLKTQQDWWKDDYGWWGNAFVKAIDSRRQLGYANPSYDQFFKDILAAAQSCWQQLLSNWRDKSYTSESDNANASAKIGGGTFNNAPDSSIPPMSGRNCVTNEGFWILSQGLAQLSTDPKYATAAKKEQDWFEQWLVLPKKSPGSTGILNPLGLVLERPTGNHTDPSWYWSGDQGLYITARNADDAASKVAAAAVQNMAKKGILHENMEFTQHFMPPGDLRQFTADYATGKGILMWSLASFRGVPFLDFIKNNASAVWCNRLTGNSQFTFNWDWEHSFPGAEPKILRINDKSDQLCDLIMQAAGQGALNAALSLGLGNQEIKCPAP